MTLYILHKYESVAEFLSCGGCFFAKTDYCIKYADKKTSQFLIFVQIHNEKPIDLCKTTMYNKLVPKGREQVEPAAKSGGETGLYFGRRIVPAADAAVCRTAAPHRKVEESMEWKMSRKLIKILAESACVMTMTSESDSRYTLIGRL